MLGLKKSKPISQVGKQSIKSHLAEFWIALIQVKRIGFLYNIFLVFGMAFQYGRVKNRVVKFPTM